MKPRQLIIRVALVSRLVIFVIGFLARQFIPQWDPSASISLGQPISQLDALIKHGLHHHLRWDAVYFAHIAHRGYIYEQEHAFFPLLPMMVRFLAAIAQCVAGDRWVSTESWILMSGVLVSLVSFVLAALMLHRYRVLAVWIRWLTTRLSRLSRHYFNARTALLASLCFCIQPAGIFMSSIYTESLFAFLSFWGMALLAEGKRFNAAWVFMAAALTRSNGILCCGFFLHDFMGKCLKDRKWDRRLIWRSVRLILCCMIVLLGFLSFEYMGYFEFCQLYGTRMKRPWCQQMIPLLYSFVQREYWNNGFLKYYELKQIPNFLLAAPMISLSLMGIRAFARDFQQALGKRKRMDQYLDSLLGQILPYYVLWGLLLVYCIFMMHIQVITRFFSSMPPLFWFVAQLLIQDLKKNENEGLKWSRVVVFYFIAYAVSTAITFSCFHPPA